MKGFFLLGRNLPVKKSLCPSLLLQMLSRYLERGSPPSEIDKIDPQQQQQAAVREIQMKSFLASFNIFLQPKEKTQSRRTFGKEISFE